MGAARTSGLVIAALAAIALALAIVASWRGDRQIAAPDGRAAAIAPGNGPGAALDPVASQQSPGAGMNAAADECANLPTHGSAGQRGEAPSVEWIGRGIEIDLSENIDVARRLALSDDPDHRLAAVLMSRDHPRQPGDKVDGIVGILERHPNHRLTFWNLVVQCGATLAHPACSDASLVASTERVDSENSQIWALLATYRERRNDYDGAIEAMQRALGSASTSTYYAEQILLFDQAYAAASDFGRSKRLVHAFGESAAQPLQHVDVYGTCTRLAKKDILWRRMCFDYGRILESRASSLIAEIFGLTLQAELAKMDGDEDTVGEVQQRLEGLRQFNISDDMGSIFDDQVNAGYLEELSVHGEKAALAFLGEEIQRRRALLDRCP